MALCKLVTYISASEPLAVSHGVGVVLDPSPPLSIAVGAYSSSTAVACVAVASHTKCRAVRATNGQATARFSAH